MWVPKREIYRLILNLPARATILINTLEIPEIQKVADVCAVFYNGRTVCQMLSTGRSTSIPSCCIRCSAGGVAEC